MKNLFWVAILSLLAVAMTAHAATLSGMSRAGTVASVPAAFVSHAGNTSGTEGADTVIEEEEEESLARQISSFVTLPLIGVVLAVVAWSMRRRFDKTRVAGVKFNGNLFVYIACVIVIIVAAIAGGADVLVLFIPSVVCLICYTIIAFAPVTFDELDKEAADEVVSASSNVGTTQTGTVAWGDVKGGLASMGKIMLGSLVAFAGRLRGADRTVVTRDVSGNVISSQKELDPTSVLSAFTVFIPYIVVLGIVLMLAFVMAQLVIVIISLLPIIKFIMNYKSYRAAMAVGANNGTQAGSDGTSSGSTAG